MKKRTGAVSAAMIDKAIPRECIHGVIMKSKCTLCFGEFHSLLERRMKTHIEYDLGAGLSELDPTDGPLTSLMRRLDFGVVTESEADRPKIGGTD